MGIAYRVMYALGFAPWDRGIPDELREVVEGPDKLSPGRALDLGCGLGRKSIYLASHDWKVVGIDAVPRALGEARRRAAAAGVEIDFRDGDVSRLGDSGLEAGFDLFFDFGCFHGLRHAERARYAGGVDRLAAPHATLLMMAFKRALPPVPSGVSSAELLQLFPGWELASEKDVSGGSTSAMRMATVAWFRLRRND